MPETPAGWPSWGEIARGAVVVLTGSSFVAGIFALLQRVLPSGDKRLDELTLLRKELRDENKELRQENEVLTKALLASERELTIAKARLEIITARLQPERPVEKLTHSERYTNE